VPVAEGSLSLTPPCNKRPTITGFIFNKPVVLGEYTGLSSRFYWGEALNVADEALDQMVDRGILMVGTHLTLGMTPQVIHRVQLRATLGQPDQTDLKLPCQPDRGACCVTGILIQQQPNRPTPVVLVDELEEGLEVLGSLSAAREQQSVTRAHVDRAEEPDCISI